MNRIDEEEPLKKSVSGQPRLRYIEILIAKNNSLVCKYNVVKCCALHFRFILNYQDAKMFHDHELELQKKAPAMISHSAKILSLTTLFTLTSKM